MVQHQENQGRYPPAFFEKNRRPVTARSLAPPLPNRNGASVSALPDPATSGGCALHQEFIHFLAFPLHVGLAGVIQR